MPQAPLQLADIFWTTSQPDLAVLLGRPLVFCHSLKRQEPPARGFALKYPELFPPLHCRLFFLAKAAPNQSRSRTVRLRSRMRLVLSTKKEPVDRSDHQAIDTFRLQTRLLGR
jgi:hypothetical protein